MTGPQPGEPDSDSSNGAGSVANPGSPGYEAVGPTVRDPNGSDLPPESRAIATGTTVPGLDNADASGSFDRIPPTSTSRLAEVAVDPRLDGTATSSAPGETTNPTLPTDAAGAPTGTERVPGLRENAGMVAGGREIAGTLNAAPTIVDGAMQSSSVRAGDGSVVVPRDFQAASAAGVNARTNDVRRSAAAVESSDSNARPAAVARAEAVNAVVRQARQNAGDARGNNGTTIPGSPTIASSGGSTSPTAQGLPGASAGFAQDVAAEGAGRTLPGVGRGLDTLARQRGGTLTMRLDPPSLGALKLDLRMEGGRVTVSMTAASESARLLLRNNLGSLRQALEDRGLAVERLTVETAARSTEGSSNARSDGRGDGQDARGGQGTSDRQDAGDGRSRGRRDDASDRRPGRGDDPGRREAADFGETLADAAVSEG